MLKIGNSKKWVWNGFKTFLYVQISYSYGKEEENKPFIP